MTIEDLKVMGDYLVTEATPMTQKGSEGGIISTNPTVYYKVVLAGKVSESEGINPGDLVSIKSGTQYEIKVGDTTGVCFPYHQVITIVDSKFEDEFIPMTTYLSPLQNSTAVPN